MRKTVRLVASVLVGMAVAGGSVTTARAEGKPVAPGHEKAPDGTGDRKAGDLPGRGNDGGVAGANACANDAHPLTSASGSSHSVVGNLFQSGQTSQVICQVGQSNHAVTYNETLVDGSGLVLAVGSVVDQLKPDVTVGGQRQTP
jgi:hypothetical protein